MRPHEILQRLQPTIKFLTAGDTINAEKAFRFLQVVNTPDHLSQPEDIQFFIWDLYELLVISNERYITREQILEDYDKLIFTDFPNE